MIPSSQSFMAQQIRRGRRTKYPGRNTLCPKKKLQKSNKYNIPVIASIMIYLGEMGSLQEEHFPFRTSQLMTGIFSHAVIQCPHFGQREGGETMDSLLGIRQIHTLRKLPIQHPKIKANTLIQTINAKGASIPELNNV